MTYAEAIRYLYELRLFGTKLGLENTRRLAALAGKPQAALRFIHVAGTNGKGSTCAILESIYRAAGLKVGMFTSPHLIQFGERIQVNRRPIPEADVAHWTRQLAKWLEHFPTGRQPTFFEVVTVMALGYFAEQGCELVIWETGMGGRMDATNIVTPLASVITNVHYDHQKWLGETIEAIAAEKAGIIKPGVPVLTAAAEPGALGVLQACANRCRAPLTVIDRARIEDTHLAEADFPLLGQHQRANATLALATVETLSDIVPVAVAARRRGLAGVRCDGRLQVLSRPGGGKLVLDGAHNPMGAECLGRALPEIVGGAPPGLVLGVLSDKNWVRICELLAPFSRRIRVVPVQSERTERPEVLAKVCRQANPQAEVEVSPHVKGALAELTNEPWVVVTGSLYLVGEALQLCQEAWRSMSAERGLNELMSCDSR